MTEIIKTLSVPAAGMNYFGLCRNASYAAAARGEIPTIRIGRLLRVPVRVLEQMLEKVCQTPVTPSSERSKITKRARWLPQD